MKAIIVETPAFNVYQHMACDEIMCENMPFDFILRFYRWSGDGITFGFSQRYLNILSVLDEKRKNYPITRRPTGGGIVIHEYDLTFSLIFYSPGEFNPVKTYTMLHSAIHKQYIKRGIDLTIARTPNISYDTNNPVMECFKKPVDMDLVSEGRKILGGALRKFADYMLYQASLQFENARFSSTHQDAIKSAFEELFNVRFERFVIDEKYINQIEKKKDTKYISDDWIKRI